MGVFETMLKTKQCFHGFQIHGRLHQFRSLILYSTSSSSVPAKDGIPIPIPIPNPLMVELLVKSVGFSHDEAVSIATDSKVSHRFKSTQNSELVIDFLKRSGFDDSHIRKVITCSPKVLRCKVEKTLVPKIKIFQELGVSASDLGLIISHYPHVLYRSLDGHVFPVLLMLKSSFGFSNEQLASFFQKAGSPRLQSGFLKYLPHNCVLLQSYGLPMEKIKQCILQRPLTLLRTTHSLEDTIKGVEEKLRIPRTSSTFLYGIYGLDRKKGHGLESWLQVFRSFGWSESEISKLLMIFPMSLLFSENALRAKLKYLMEELGYGCDYLATRPALLGYSMEKRMVPRTAVLKALKEKQLLKNGVSWYYFVSMPESKFMDQYMIPARDQLPKLYEYYIQAKAGSLTKAHEY